MYKVFSALAMAVAFPALAVEQLGVDVTASQQSESSGFHDYAVSTDRTRLTGSVALGLASAAASVNSKTRQASASATVSAGYPGGYGATGSAYFTSRGLAPIVGPRTVYLVYQYAGTVTPNFGAFDTRTTYSAMDISGSDGLRGIQASLVLNLDATCGPFWFAASTLGCFEAKNLSTTGSIAFHASPGLQLFAQATVVAIAGEATERASTNVKLRWSAVPVGPVFDPYLAAE